MRPDQTKAAAAPGRQRPVDPVAIRRANSLEERSDRGALEAVLAPPDRPYRENPEREDEQREGQGVAPRHEEERRREHDRKTRRRELDPVRSDPILQRPERQQHQRVGERRRRDEAIERDRGDEHGRDHRGDGREHTWSRGSELDPGQQRDAEQGSDVEHVALLDPVRELGGERRHDRDDAHDQGDRRREKCLQPRVERASSRYEDDRRGEWDDEHVQRQLRDVPPQVPEHLAEVVRLLAHG